MTEAPRLRLLELAIKSGASAAMAVARAIEFERFTCPSTAAPSGRPVSATLEHCASENEGNALRRV